MRGTNEKKAVYISIHAPREGSDPGQMCICPGETISIHAPREGSDFLIVASSAHLSYFNPRSPRGERLIVGTDDPLGFPFQSTLPARGATAHRPHCRRFHADFNPRSPRGERRGVRVLVGFIWENFNPRSPRGERHGRARVLLAVSIISIHAPREGSDGELVGQRQIGLVISIHAPREGSDPTPPA